LIRRDGEVIQYVPFDRCAHHAGESGFGGKTRCNDFSIGIELEGADDIPYTDGQYTQLVRVTRAIMKRWPGIGLDQIVGHSDIAPGRKTDPGEAFDWDRYRAAIRS
jgi:AmpD protein